MTRYTQAGNHDTVSDSVFTMKMIAEEWRITFGAIPPLGHVCRAELNDRWFRIHSLPESKRYPEDDLERQEICRRHNEVATRVLGLKEECILLIGRYSGNPDGAEEEIFSDCTRALPPQPELFWQLDEDSWMGFCGERTTWVPGEFDQLIRDVADEEEYNVLFFSPSRASIYSPYDGGADLILPIPDLVAPSKERWSSWLSGREDGL